MVQHIQQVLAAVVETLVEEEEVRLLSSPDGLKVLEELACAPCKLFLGRPTILRMLAARWWPVHAADSPWAGVSLSGMLKNLTFLLLAAIYPPASDNLQALMDGRVAEVKTRIRQLGGYRWRPYAAGLGIVDFIRYTNKSQYDAALLPHIARAENNARRGEFPLYQPLARFATTTTCDLLLACWLTFVAIDGLAAVFLFLWVVALTVGELQEARKSFKSWLGELLNSVSGCHLFRCTCPLTPPPPPHPRKLPPPAPKQHQEPCATHHASDSRLLL